MICVLGNFASKDFGIFLRNFCGHFAETVIFRCKLTSIAEVCGDDESAHKPHRNMPKSWLVKLPIYLSIYLSLSLYIYIYIFVYIYMILHYISLSLYIYIYT